MSGMNPMRGQKVYLEREIAFEKSRMSMEKRMQDELLKNKMELINDKLEAEHLLTRLESIMESHGTQISNLFNESLYKPLKVVDKSEGIYINYKMGAYEGAWLDVSGMIHQCGILNGSVESVIAYLTAKIADVEHEIEVHGKRINQHEVRQHYLRKELNKIREKE